MPSDQRGEREAPGDLGRQIARGIRLTTSRTPSQKEIDREAAFVRKLQNQTGMTVQKALAQYCLLLLNANEFVYLD